MVRVGANVDFIDMGILNSLRQELYLKLLKQPRSIAIYADVHMKIEVAFVIELAKRIAPKSRVLVYGPLATYYPVDILNHFDTIHISGGGDYETIIEAFHSGSPKERKVEGRWLEGSELCPPNLDLFDPRHYQRLLDLDRNRSQALNVGVSVGRGCGHGCSYCRLTIEGNRKDRRMPIKSLIDYILSIKESAKINYFKFLSPNFGSNKEWVTDFLAAVRPLKLQWKCCTRPEYFLDTTLAIAYAEAGCVSVSVGLEVFSTSAYKKIGRRSSYETALSGIKSLRSAGISVKCLVMLGVPGVDLDQALTGMELIEKTGAVLRPSLYTDYGKLTWSDIDFADKRTPVHQEHLNSTLMELVYDRKGKMF